MASNKSQMRTTVCHESQTESQKNLDGPLKQSIILCNSSVAHRGFKLMWFLYLNAYFEHPAVLPGIEIDPFKQHTTEQ